MLKSKFGRDVYILIYIAVCIPPKPPPLFFFFCKLFFQFTQLKKQFTKKKKKKILITYKIEPKK